MRNFPSSVEKYLKDKKHDSLHLARKYARIFIQELKPHMTQINVISIEDSDRAVFVVFLASFAV